MEALLRERRASVLALVAASAVGPASLLHFFGNEQVTPPSWVHFSFIAVGATIAAVAAIALTTVGARRGDGRTVLLGTAFTAMTALLAVHGLATPGVIVGQNGVIAFAGAAVLPVGGAVLALSALPGLRRPRAVRPLLVLDGVLVVSIVALGSIGLLSPETVPAVPAAKSPAAIALMVAGLCFFGVLALRAARTFTLTRRWSDLMVVLGVVWLGVALVAQLMLSFPALGWWLGHVLELVGVALVGVPVALDLHRGSQSRPLAGDLSAAELVFAEEAFLGPRVRALMVRLAEKDSYTEGHTRRVALRSVEVGEALGLSPGRLRSLAIGGLLHDIGKLSVPDAILQKPGPLDDDEYDVIRRHPEWGEQLIVELGGFRDEVRRLVLSHHERLDASGYPHALRGDELDLETRILAVCDVYDALISTRVYRDAWSPDRALALLREEAGTSFDGACVEALERVLRGEPGPQRAISPAPAPAFAR
jgi:HD-GYP domain-containing protein (c-di-GMP phosphodiesterase class II)